MKTKNLKYRLQKTLITGLIVVAASIGFLPAVAYAQDEPAVMQGPIECSTVIPATEIESRNLTDLKCYPNTEENQNASCPNGYYKDTAIASSLGISTDTIICLPSPIEAVNLEAQAQIRNTATFLIEIQKFLNTLLWPVLVIIGGLLDNSLLFGSGMEERLREIWIPIRNIVNILFVIALVGIALYNILGLGEEGSNYSIKEILPKIIVGIIAVNFSFLAITVFLDAVNVMTTSVFALPDQVNEGLSDVFDEENQEDQEIIYNFCKIQQESSLSATPTVIEGDVDAVVYRQVAEEYNIENAQNMTPEQILTAIPPDQKEDFLTRVAFLEEGEICNELNELTPIGKIFLKEWNSQNAALAMALSMGKIVFYPQVALSVETTSDIIINTLFSGLLYLIYVVSFLALFVVLLGRLVVLWLAIALSPILLLGMAVPVIKEKISMFGTINEKFIKNAIAPLLIGLAMTIGWIMLSALKSINTFDSNSIMNITMSVPVAGLNTLQDVIVSVGTIAVVWLGVFTAAEGTIAESVTNWMKDGLTRAGKWLGTLPLKHTPFIPIDIPGVEGEEGLYTADQLKYAIDTGTRSTDYDKLTKAIQGAGAGVVQSLRDLSNPNKIASAEDFHRGLYDMRNEIATDAGNEELKAALADPKIRDMLVDYDRANGTDLVPQLDEMTAINDETKRKDKFDQIMNNERYIERAGVTPPPTTTPPATGPEAAAAQGAITQPEINNIVTITGDTNKTEQDIQDELIKLQPKLEANNQNTLTGLKEVFGQEQAAKIIEKVGGEKNASEILRTGKAPAPAAPAAENQPPAEQTSPPEQPPTQEPPPEEPT